MSRSKSSTSGTNSGSGSGRTDKPLLEELRLHIEAPVGPVGQGAFPCQHGTCVGEHRAEDMAFADTRSWTHRGHAGMSSMSAHDAPMHTCTSFMLDTETRKERAHA